jgi:serine/threonine protein kinase
MNQTNDMTAMLATVPAVIRLTTSYGKPYMAKTSNEFIRGGEGRILRCDEDPKLALKVYHPTRTPLTEDRFKHLTKLNDAFVKPKELLYDGNELAGFTMELLSKDYFNIQNLLQKEFCRNNGVTLDTKLKIFRKLIDAVKHAHALGIVIGDLNQYNIMVTLKGDVKFLDVDSYETPNHKHSGILLEDVRDYYYQGKVSKNSDYFALSVLLFSMACFVHPFKGVHARWKKIADRMINKLPVFKDDPDLKLPRFYEPLKKGHLLTQFERMYLDKVERFIIEIDQKQTVTSIFATADLPKPSAVKKYQQDSLMVQEIMVDTIESVSVMGGRMLVRTGGEYIIYDCSNKSYVSVMSRLERKDWDQLFLGTNSLIGIKDGVMHIQTDARTGFVKNTSVAIEPSTRFHQNDNILFAVYDDRLLVMNMDKVYGGNIDYSMEVVHGDSFNHFGGFFYRAGQRQLFYSIDKGMMNTLTMPVNIVGLYQMGRVGMVKYIEKKGKDQRVINKYYKINGREVLLSTRDADDIYQFAYQQGPKAEGFIMQPQNQYIRVIRTDDFEEVERLNLDICTTQSTIKISPSGLILWEDDSLWLLNKK